MEENNKDKSYLLGRTIAIVATMENQPNEFIAKVFVNPFNKLSYWLAQSMKKTDSDYYEELISVMTDLGIDYRLPLRLNPEESGKAWIGYYHQRYEINKYEDRKEIGLKLKAIRLKKDLTIRQMADLCDVSFQNITKIENGKYNVSIDILNKICNALDLKIELIEK